MGVQGGWVGQKGSKKHVRNIWTAPDGKIERQFSPGSIFSEGLKG